MSFRERMRVDPSNAEIQVTAELQRQKVYEAERDWVLLIKALEVVPMRMEQVTYYDLEGVRFTKPDWFSPPQVKSIYLDGPVHLKPKTAERDYWIDTWLRERGYPLLRIPYNGRRFPHFRLFQVVDEIKEFLKQ